VLNVLKKAGRSMALAEIYRAMERHPLVTAHHRELWGNQPNFHHWVRSAIAKLKRRGAVRQIGRAIYISN
jgi:hypothetical protein